MAEVGTTSAVEALEGRSGVKLVMALGLRMAVAAWRLGRIGESVVKVLGGGRVSAVAMARSMSCVGGAYRMGRALHVSTGRATRVRACIVAGIGWSIDV